MKNIFLMVLVLLTGFINAQNVGINTSAPLTTLDINGVPATVSAVDGLRAPRITLAQLNAKTGYNSTHEGAMVYVTNVSGSTVTSTAKVSAPGYYYFDGSVWKSVVAKAGSVVFIASLGNGNGGASNAPIPATTFYTVPLPTINKNTGGGVWSTTDNTYTVPVSGTYLIKSSIRLVDGSTGRNVFQAVNTANADIPEGLWQTNTGGRWTMLYNRIAYFNRNDVLRLYMYSDGTAANVSDASLNIVLLGDN
ncbi:hypothetical protein [Chryseobacterium sp. GP-SGM7]|uniref:hypothetical protein n=1 Tax=Chryseobacterium sp. GP-SGM7 TaxID=3411323 RepID=UPI003B94EB3A